MYRKIALVCWLAAFSASLDGYQGHFNGSIVSNKGFIRQFSPPGTTILNAKWVSAWGGIASTTQCLAQIAMVFVSDKFGRRIALWCTWVLLAASILVESLVTTNAGWLGAKMLSGAGIGSMQGTLPLFINELSPTQIRGLFTEAYTFWYVSGQLMSSVALQRLNKTHPYDFRLAIYTQWGMIGGLALVYLVLPESPWWLVMKGKTDKARRTLLRLKGGIPEYDVEVELQVMENTINEQRHRAQYNKAIPLKEIFRGMNGKRLIIALWPKLCQQFVGLSVFNSYATYFFQVAGNKDPFLVTVILSCTQLISMCFTMILVDNWGRRPLTVYGYMITVLADFGMGACGTQNIAGNEKLGSLLVFFACLATFSTTSSSAIGYAYLSEIPKQDFRAKSAGWGLAIPNFFSIMFSFVTPIMIKGAPAWGAKTGFFFGCTGAIVVTIAWFIIPETARRTPAEIDEMFETHVPLRKFKGHITAVQMSVQQESNERQA